MHYLIERQGTPLFGSPKRAEAIVAWSQRHPDGSRFNQSYPTGISLELVAHGATPRVFFYFKPSELGKRLKELGKPDVLHLTATGFSIRVKDGSVDLSLIAAPAKAHILWRGCCPLEASFPELLGLVELAEDGIRFYPKNECPTTPSTLVQPLAVIGGASLPKPLSTQARRWLVRDVVSNLLLTPR